LVLFCVCTFSVTAAGIKAFAASGLYNAETVLSLQQRGNVFIFETVSSALDGFKWDNRTVDAGQAGVTLFYSDAVSDLELLSNMTVGQALYVPNTEGDLDLYRIKDVDVSLTPAVPVHFSKHENILLLSVSRPVRDNTEFQPVSFNAEQPEKGKAAFYKVIVAVKQDLSQTNSRKQGY
jgi:hypothetical protein